MSTGQLLGAGGGAALGAFLALPTGGVSVGMGALYGMQAGMMVGGYLDPPKGPTQSGPRLSDTSQQTSTYGAVIPRVYGTIGVMGNIFWLEHNKLKEVVKKKKSGGKGGGSSAEIKTYTYYGTFAVGLCEGPIAGVRRIWVGPDLVYDAGSDDLETIIASNQASSKFTIYLGTADQQPDPRMQAEMGVTNCPAYRGLAYIVVKDLLLTKYGNSIQGAPIKAEIVEAATKVGFRQTLDVQSGASYKTYLGDGAGAPYLDFAQGYAIVTTSAGKTKVHSNEGLASGSGGGKFLPVEAGGTYYCGYLSSGIVLSIRNIGSVFSFADCSVALGIPPLDVAGKYIYGMTTSLNGEYIIALFTSSSGITGTIVDGHFYLMDKNGAVLKEGGCDESSAYGPVCFGRSAQYHFGASCLSNDGSALYFSLGSGSRQVEKWSVGTNLEYVESIMGALVSGGLFSRPAIGEDSGCIYIAAGTGFYHVVDQEKITPSQRSVGSIIIAEASLVGLVAGVDISCDLITSTLVGYKVSAIGSVRAAVEPLQGAFPFDLIQSGYQIKAVPRGNSSVANIDIGDLGVDEQLHQSREMDTQLPTKIVATYLDKARNYDPNEQFWERPSSGAVNTRTMELPIVFGASQALQVVERLGNLYWLERADFGPFKLPPTFGALEPDDVVTLHAGYADYELRLTTVSYQSDGSLECSGKLNSPSLYISDAVSDETPDAGVIPLSGVSLAVLLDIPVVDEALQNSPGFVSALTSYASGWPGGVLFSSQDDGQTWIDLQGFLGKGSFGIAAGPLAGNAGNLIQRGGTLNVSLYSGQAESVTEAQMLNGANIAAYGAPGRWEIIRYQNATLNVDGSYTLDTFWRGDKGTEWATGLHVAGDLIVLMNDPDNAFIGMSLDSIGQPRTYRPITAGATIDTTASTAFTYAGVNLECLSPAHPVGVRDGSANLTASWKRRTRVGGAWRDNVDASLSETTEAYEIDVMSGSTVKRTLTSSTPTVTYSAANQVTDFGSAQSSITLRIYQLSSVVGRGYPLETTL